MTNLSTSQELTTVEVGLNHQENSKSKVWGINKGLKAVTETGVLLDSLSEDSLRNSFEYVLTEGVNNTGSSRGSGDYGGTSGNDNSKHNVVFTGRDEENSKKLVLLKIDLKDSLKKYLVGQYSVVSENSKDSGELELGVMSCPAIDNSPQCQLNKSNSSGISKKLKIRFTKLKDTLS